MYSTNMKNNRYLVSCIVVSEDVAIDKFVVDTGARYTCCSYWLIDDALEESQFSRKDAKEIGGLVKGESVLFYKYSLKQFTIGNINMGAQDIWITFDERVSDIIVGMDILKQVIMIANPYDQRLYFCKDADDYSQNFKLLAD